MLNIVIGRKILIQTYVDNTRVVQKVTGVYV